MKQKVFFLIVLLFSLKNFSQNNKTIFNYPLIESYLIETYSFSFDKAEIILGQLENQGVDFQTIYYIKANDDWWHILNGDDTATYLNQCRDNIEKSINSYNASNSKTLNKKIILFNSYLLASRYNNYQKNKLKSSLMFIKFIKLANKIKDEIKDEDLKIFVNGIYHYFLSYSKENSFVAAITLHNFQSKGMDVGLNFLEESAKSNNLIIKTESLYLLYKIYSELEHKPFLAENKIRELTLLYPKNIFYNTEYYKMLVKNYNPFVHNEKKTLIFKIKNSKLLNLRQKTHFLNIIKNYKP